LKSATRDREVLAWRRCRPDHRSLAAREAVPASGRTAHPSRPPPWDERTGGQGTSPQNPRPQFTEVPDVAQMPRRPNGHRPGNTPDPGEITAITEALAAGVPLQDVQTPPVTQILEPRGAMTTGDTTSTATRLMSWLDIW